MDCAEARPLIQRGVENEDLLDHIAGCAACRARNESTEFVKLPGKSPPPARRLPPIAPGDATSLTRLPAKLRDAPLPPPRHGPGALPWIVGGVAVVVIAVALTVILMRREAHTDGLERVSSPHPHGSSGMPEILGPHKLTITSEPEGTVFIDGKKRGTTPFVGDGLEGRMRIEVRAVGFITAARTIDMDGGDQELVLTLEKPKKVVAPEPKAKELEEATGETVGGGYGYLSIRATPFAHVILDDHDLHRSTPVLKLSVPVGPHHLLLKTDTKQIDVDVTVARGKELSISKSLE